MELFKDKSEKYTLEVNTYLQACLPKKEASPQVLHEAMHYAVMNGGKRIRPLLTYASAEALDIDPLSLTPAAASIELLHCFSLVHDDLPAMDDDDLRRGSLSLHKAFNEGIAILAADAMQSLAFHVLANDSSLNQKNDIRVSLSSLIAEASGTSGMTGGQALDIESEGKIIDLKDLEHIYHLKTGKLLRACIMAPVFYRDISQDQISALESFIKDIGLAFQIQDDIIEVEGDTEYIGKPSESDEDKDKATFPKIIGLDASKRRVLHLFDQSNDAISIFGEKNEGLKYLAKIITERTY
ncbi:polyprenyl synthetase family protein [Gammaproteobacteria bacterium]|jgi:geranylgeranyl diphosphate synthase, type II|nr:polyprenyl synthetase family protein [Gammaproteobacteria bacterium]